MNDLAHGPLAVARPSQTYANCPSAQASTSSHRITACCAWAKRYIGRLRPEWNGQRISCNHVTHADNTSIAATAGALQQLFGQPLVAAIAGVRDLGVRDLKAVGRWASGQDIPRDEAAAALQNALAIVELLRTQENDETVLSWFRGVNPELGDHPPALLVRKQPANVAQAARVFLSI